jgi:hypothetical protein
MSRRALFGLGGVGLALLVGALVDGRGVLAAVLSAGLACVTLPLGCLLWALMLPLVRGQWQTGLAPALAAGQASLPWALVGLWVLVPAAWLLYPWGEHPSVGFRGVWLHPLSFLLRALMYAVLWSWLARRARAGNGQVSAGLGLIVAVLSLSAAGIDWWLSLDKALASTVFGLFFVTRALLMGLAWAGLNSGGQNQRLVRALLLGTVMFWVYLHFMQYLVVWGGNLPREIHWYLDRSHRGWGAVGVLLITTQAIVPLVLLALPWGKRPQVLRWACGLTLVSALVESAWLGLPSLGLAPSLWLPLAGIGWAGTIAGLTLWRRHHDH